MLLADPRRDRDDRRGRGCGIVTRGFDRRHQRARVGACEVELRPAPAAAAAAAPASARRERVAERVLEPRRRRAVGRAGAAAAPSSPASASTKSGLFGRSSTARRRLAGLADALRPLHVGSAIGAAATNATMPATRRSRSPTIAGRRGSDEQQDDRDDEDHERGDEHRETAATGTVGEQVAATQLRARRRMRGAGRLVDGGHARRHRLRRRRADLAAR